MRYPRVFYCPKCEARDPVDPVCRACRTPRVARDGGQLSTLADRTRGPLPHAWARGLASLGGVAAGAATLSLGSAVLVSAAAIPATAAIVAGAIAGGEVLVNASRSDAMRLGRHVRRLRRALPVAPIGRWIEDAGIESSMVAVRGRVHVVDALKSADGDCAAWARREILERNLVSQSLGGSVYEKRRHALSSRACGRFVLADDSGAAWVDDDAFVIWPPPDVGAKPTEARIAAGDEIVVYGRARVEPADSEVQAHTPASYRGSARALRFEGEASQPLVLMRVSQTAG